MNKNVIISVKGTQMPVNQDPTMLELVTEGRYYKKGNTYYITYKESEVTGLEGTTTTLTVAGGVVTLIRSGTVNSQMIFEKGQKHMSHYDTGFGAFTIGVFASDVEIEVDDKGGEIWVDYQLEIDNNKSGENDFHMHIREAGSSNAKRSGKDKVGN